MLSIMNCVCKGHNGKLRKLIENFFWKFILIHGIKVIEKKVKHTFKLKWHKQKLWNL